MEYSITIYTKDNKSIIEQCNNISKSHHKSNGGILEFENLVDESDVIFCAEENNEIYGFLCIKSYSIFQTGCYIELLAVKKEYLRKGIARALVKYVIDYAKNEHYSKILLNVKKINVASISLFKSLGFTEYNMSENEYLSIGFCKEEINRNNAYYMII